MKVLIVTQYFWPENFRISDLAEGLRDRGHQVAVLTGKPNYPSGRFFSGYGFLKRNKDSYKGITV
ncbi:MAG: glycosyltransferase WbuB, partial [Clostridiales bacterium]|nr:glycosyltransferase WbuB [Clostridiales bacterium]